MTLIPPWMDTAKKLIGLKEVRGRGNNPTILKWAKVIGGWTGSYYKRDSIPWCGLFVAHVLAQNGIRPFNEALRAKAWAKWGRKLSYPRFGAIMVFTRKGGGHVGFYVSEDKYYYHILGGNQSDMVNVTKINKKRFMMAVWPKGEEFNKFLGKSRIHRKFNGKVSINEA